LLIKVRRGQLTRWAKHFRNLFNNINLGDPNILDKLPDLPPIPDLDITASFSEVYRPTQSLKNNKSPGPDGIPREVFKYGGHHAVHRLHKFICSAWEAEVLPQQWKEWKDANIVTIFKKKGDKSDCGNYCGISLLSVAGKVLARVMLVRLLNHVVDVVLPDAQCGFRKRHSS